jgi:ankyrin repeat protein
MQFRPLRFDAPVGEFEDQAKALLTAHGAGDDAAIALLHRLHPRFLDVAIPWLPRRMAEGEIRAAVLDMNDARLAVARGYNFVDWPALEEFAARVRSDAELHAFESAVEAVVDGDGDTLALQLRQRPELVKARSERRTNFDPPVHGATLLHYVAANGVEQFRQRTPASAVAMARLLLEAGADANATAHMYGGGCTVLSMLVSSSHPAEAGVQAALAEVLLDFGASLEPVGRGNWQSPLMTALVFGYQETAEVLLCRGAPADTLPVAAALGRLPEARHLLPTASPEQRHAALALAAQMGHAEVVRVLLDAGEDPDRFNPEGTHKHSTPLHQAALGGHEAVVRLLVERGAATGQKDRIHQSTALGWAEYGHHTAIAEYLRGLN